MNLSNLLIKKILF